MILLRLLLRGEMCQARGWLPSWMFSQASQADVLYDKYGPGYLVTLTVQNTWLTLAYLDSTHHNTTHAEQVLIFHFDNFLCLAKTPFSQNIRTTDSARSFQCGAKTWKKEISASGIIITSAWKLKWWIKHNSHYPAKVAVKDWRERDWSLIVS